MTNLPAKAEPILEGEILPPGEEDYARGHAADAMSYMMMFGGGRRQGKSWVQRMMLEGLLRAGATVVKRP
jgi:hypothetical protein